MKESKDSLTPIDKLKEEIDLRYRILSYRKLHHNFLLNRIEKNNYNIIMEGIADFSVIKSQHQ